MFSAECYSPHMIKLKQTTPEIKNNNEEPQNSEYNMITSGELYLKIIFAWNKYLCPINVKSSINNNMDALPWHHKIFA